MHDIVAAYFSTYKGDLLQEPWRVTPNDNATDVMINYLEDFEPSTGLDIKTYNILLVGAIGSGKSSFYNTIAAVFSKRVKEIAPANDSPDGVTSVTNKIHGYVLKTDSGKELKIKIVDIWGFHEKRGYDYELDSILEGKLQEYHIPDKPVPVKEFELKNATLKDKIHLVCFVTESNNLDKVSDGMKMRITEIKNCINKKGIPIVVVATKLDLVMQRRKKSPDDADSVYHSSKAYDATKKVSKLFGIDEIKVFPVVNFKNDADMNTGKEKLVLEALYEMVNRINYNLENFKASSLSIDTWSERAYHLQIPRAKLEREEMLAKLISSINELEDNALCIFCIGEVQSGKTSFIDSVLSALRDEIYNVASGGYVSEESSQRGGNLVSTTEKFQMYRVKYKVRTDSKLKLNNIFLGDLPGLQITGGITEKAVKNVLKGHIKNKTNLISGNNPVDKTSREGRKVSCICFVFDISKSAEDIAENIKVNIKSIHAWLRDKDIPYIVILTKGDKLCEDSVESAHHLFDNKILKENKDRLRKTFNFKESILFPVVNYIHEDKTVPVYNALLIAAFQRVLELGKEYLENEEYQASDGSDDENGSEE